MANKGKCKHCGAESGNLSVHEPKCEKNPVNVKAGEPAQPPQQPLIIKDVRELDGVLDLSCYFKVEGTETIIEKSPDFVGIMVSGSEEIPCVLITGQDGRILPPFMFQGFIGMYPQGIKETGKQPEESPKPEVNNKDEDALREYVEEPEPEKPPIAEVPSVEKPKEKSGIVETLKNLGKKQQEAT